MRLLHAQTGTVWSIVDEKDLVITMVSLIFKQIKFINVNVDLTFEGNIAKILYKEMHIPEPFKAVWWGQMKVHIRKKMDERHSNCGAAIKKSILSNYQCCQSWFLCKLSSHILAHCINRFIRSKKSPYFRNNSAKEREPRVFLFVLWFIPIISGWC